MARLDVTDLGSRFPHPFAPGTANRISWKEALKLGAQRSSDGCRRVGEIHGEADLEGVPRDEPLKAIYIPGDQGGAIRWGDPRHMNAVLGMMGYHDGFRCLGDTLPAETREGYITVTSSGEVVLHIPPGGGQMPNGRMG